MSTVTVDAVAAPTPRNKTPRRAHKTGCECIDCQARAAAGVDSRGKQLWVSATSGHGVPGAGDRRRPRSGRPAPTQQWGPEDEWASRIAANENAVRNEPKLTPREIATRRIGRAMRAAGTGREAGERAELLAQGIEQQAEFVAHECDRLQLLMELCGYVNFNDENGALTKRLAVYTEGVTFVSDPQTAPQDEPPTLDDLRAIGLTDREIAVLSCSHDGNSQRRVAELLDISAGYVCMVLSSAMNKLTAAGRKLGPTKPVEALDASPSKKPKTITYDPDDLDAIEVTGGTAKPPDDDRTSPDRQR